MGTTSANQLGITLRGDSDYIYVARNEGITSYFDRKSTDGAITEFRKDGTTVGSIGTGAGEIIVGRETTGLKFQHVTRQLIPRTTANASADAEIDLGSTSSRFKDLHLSGNVYANALRHDGDYNTYVAFLPDRIYMDRGGNRAFDADSGSTRFGRPDGSEAMRIDSSGRVGIGTSLPSAKATIEDGDFARLDLNLSNATGTTIADVRGLVQGTEKWRIGKTGSSSDDFAINVTGSERYAHRLIRECGHRD